MPCEELVKPMLIGRTSSHFTRVARIFAAEMRVDYSFRVAPDLMSFDSCDYGGNPALRLPTLRTLGGAWFGALNICRELSRQSSAKTRVVWPEDLDRPLLANAQELVVQAMSTEVALIMAEIAGQDPSGKHELKLRTSLVGSLGWLEENAEAVLAALPEERDISYLEVTLFCLVTHLKFREVLATEGYKELNGFCQRFAARASAQTTPYRFDA